MLTHDIALAFNNELQQELKELKDQLPINQEYSVRKLSQWWQANGRDIAEQLTVIMSAYRQIGIDWEFSIKQPKKIKDYYDANKLLADCLNSDCYVSREIREEIENTLLLPLSRIEKRKSEK